MKKASSCLVLLFCGVLCVAAGNPAVGKWNCVSDDGHGAVYNVSVILNDKQGALSGSLIGNEETIPLIDPKLDGDLLTFKVFINENCTLLFRAKVAGNKLDGTFSCPEVSGTLKGTKQP